MADIDNLDDPQDANPTTVPAAIGSFLKGDSSFDILVSGWALAHAVPLPPSVVKRLRVATGKLIDGVTDMATSGMKRFTVGRDFDDKIHRDVVGTVAKAGAKELGTSATDVTTHLARTMLNEYRADYDNRVQVTGYALEDLSINAKEPADANPDAAIDPDWLNQFSKIAAQKSNPEMQQLMGKILAGEIRQPGSFSPLTINVLATLTHDVARKFEDLCSVAVAFPGDGADCIPLDLFPAFLTSGIPEIDLNYADLLALRAHRLLGYEPQSGFRIKPGQEVAIRSADGAAVATAIVSQNTRQINLALFTSMGAQLRRLIPARTAPVLRERMSATYGPPDWDVLIREG